LYELSYTSPADANRIRLIIESDGNPPTIIIKLSKNQLLDLLDKILTDEQEAKGE
jgi:hypothetical protein